jgi:hypothetical protein
MYKGPPNSCPHLDNAIDEFDNLAEEIKHLVQQRSRTHESEIEAARDINAKLRDDNIELVTENELLRGQISDLEEEIKNLKHVLERDY